MKVGPILVDAKGVSRLYQHRIHKRDLALLVLSAVFTLVVITLISEPVRLVLRGYWLALRSEEHTSELQSLMRISYAVFCLKKKKNNNKNMSSHRKHTIAN